MLAKTLLLCRLSAQIAILATALTLGNVAIVYAQSTDSGATAGAGADSGDGSSSADSQ
jgi:hypothetical protein